MRPTDALAGAEPAVYWLDRPARPQPSEALRTDLETDLVVVGAGYTGLWTALQALEREPGRGVVVIDAGAVGEQASGRNGGFCSASLTHGVANGVDRFPDEMPRLQELGRRNLDEIEAAVQRYGIECGFERTGNLTVATEPWLVDPLRHEMELERAHGEEVDWLDRDALAEQIVSPTYHAGTWRRHSEAMVDPARLAWGLAAAVRSLGGTIHEHTPMTALERHGAGMVVRTPAAQLRSRSVVLGTNAFASPVKAIRRRIAPVYDHVLVTEPLDDAQMSSVGWANRQGVADMTNLFHYSRLTEDRRILWGGYDAVYHWRNRIDPSLEQRDATHRLLAEQFFTTYPQLEGLRFSHRWGGVIDTSTRFTVGFGTAFDGRVAFAVGYTGLGVGAARFGAEVCLDLLDRPDSSASRWSARRRCPSLPSRSGGWASR